MSRKEIVDGSEKRLQRHQTPPITALLSNYPLYHSLKNDEQEMSNGGFQDDLHHQAEASSPGRPAALLHNPPGSITQH